MIIQEFVSDNEKRTSYIQKADKFMCVLFYEDHVLKSWRDFSDKSLRYMEDAAENWTLYIPE